MPSGTLTAVNRWADGASSSGINGQATNVAGATLQYINGNKTPIGGPTNCPWTTNNCGPNTEPFSFHVGGTQVLMGDGSVRFLSENLNWLTLRNLVARADGGVVGDF